MTGRFTQRMENKLIRKREMEAERHRMWTSQCKYYDQFTRSNERFNNWTSPEMSAISQKKYQEMEEERRKARELEEERNRRDLIMYQQKQKEEIAAQEEIRKKRDRFKRNNDTPLEVLREINANLKEKEELERRLNAEKKLYEHWRLNNPSIRRAEMNQRQSNLKVAWLDAQIEKQMAKEKEELEMKKMLEERAKKIKEEEDLEKEYENQLKQKEKDLYAVIDRQVEELKQKDLITEALKQEEAEELRKRDKFDEIMKEREEIQSRRTKLELDLYNLNQYRLKLRRRAKLIADQVAEEKRMLEKILEIQQAEKEEENKNKINLKQTLESGIKYLKTQQELENQRQEYLSFIFDSEAKAMWQKQENIWLQEQNARDNLFNDVMATIKNQIDERLQQKIEGQKQLLDEKENIVKQIERADEELRREKEEIERKRLERRKELDFMVDDKMLRERQAKLLEEIEREKQLEKYRLEEERIRKEIEAIQLEIRPQPVRYPRRRILW